MTIRQKIVTHISIAAMFSIGIFASLADRGQITEYVTPSDRPIRMKLIEIKAHPQTPGINSTSDVAITISSPEKHQK
jgi:hypothetical protein